MSLANVRWLKIACHSLIILALLGTISGQQATLARREFFYVGGKYTGPPGKEVMVGQMYVEVWRPSRITHRYPIVFFHGGKQTATNWMTTLDGQPGWADYFLNQGYVVYLTDQPARGRSAWQAAANGPMSFYYAPEAYRLTRPELFGTWPQAKKHTQWPSQGEKSGQMGDPVFDAFYATQVESLASAIEIQRLVQAAGTALLDKIGPAILITHSQAGAFAWLLADQRPQAVKGIVAIEPSGPPFRNVLVKEDTSRQWGLPWGITDIPLTYAPPAKDASELAPVQEEVADDPDFAKCWIQSAPARQLPNLQGIPILLMTSESSSNSIYDHCTSRYLSQAGVKNTYMRLGDQGIHGNGHFVMIEKNSLDIAALIDRWLRHNVK